MKNDREGVEAEELELRLAGLSGRMENSGFDGVLIVQKTDLFYYSGTAQQGWLYVPVKGKPILMIFKEFERASHESPLAEIISIASAKKIPQVLAEYGYPPPRVLGMELDVLPTNLYFQYQDIFPGSRIEDISSQIRLQRAVKSSYELAKIRAAATLSDRVAAKAAELIVPGRTEVEIAGQLEGYARGLGHQGLVRMRMFGAELHYGHLLAGADAAVPSYLASPTGGRGVSRVIGQGAGHRPIERDEPVLVDYVFALDGYLSDHARIFCVGQVDPKLEKAHEAMLAIQYEVMRQAVPGAVCGDIYDMMVSRAEDAGYGPYFMGVGERRIRFTGHGLGLELDEFPFLAKSQQLVLEENMVIALEPKTIFPGLGVVGIENTHVVTDTGLERLTNYDDHITILR